MKLTVNLKERSYDVTVGSGILSEAKNLFDISRKVLIVTDDNVPYKYSEEIAAQAKDPIIRVVPNGEKSKSVKTAEYLLKEMLENNFGRRDCVLAVGGGVIGDLAGFVSSLYMRGIDFYNVPTTVLSQVDSSIGGKVAVNFEGVKNIIGAFHQPKGVLIDIKTLETLPERQIKNGLIEALKSGVIRDASLFETFESQDGIKDIETIIGKSLEVKRKIVENDEKESGERKLLNFGHTIGHGIESAAHGKLFHGECVALGMYLISDGKLKNRLKKIYENMGIWDGIYAEYLKILDNDREEIIRAVTHDKKASGGLFDAVVADDIGKGYVKKMTPEEITAKIGR